MWVSRAPWHFRVWGSEEHSRRSKEWLERTKERQKSPASQHPRSLQRQGRWSVVPDVGPLLPSPLSPSTWGLAGEGDWRVHLRPPESLVAGCSWKGLRVREAC